MTEKVKRPRRKLLPGLVGTVLLLAVIISFCVRQAEVMAARRRLAEIEREIEYYRAMNEALMEQVETLKARNTLRRWPGKNWGL